jgi:hypothetical protein
LKRRLARASAVMLALARVCDDLVVRLEAGSLRPFAEELSPRVARPAPAMTCSGGSMPTTLAFPLAFRVGQASGVHHRRMGVACVAMLAAGSRLG